MVWISCGLSCLVPPVYSMSLQGHTLVGGTVLSREQSGRGHSVYGGIAWLGRWGVFKCCRNSGNVSVRAVSRVHDHRSHQHALSFTATVSNKASVQIKSARMHCGSTYTAFHVGVNYCATRAMVCSHQHADRHDEPFVRSHSGQHSTFVSFLAFLAFL